MSDTVRTPKFRCSYVFVFKAQKPMAGSSPDATDKYSLTMLFKKGEDLSKLIAAASAAAKGKFGDKLTDPTPAAQAGKTKGQVFTAGLRSPFRDQGEKDSDGYEAGAIFIRATSKLRPGLVNAQCEDIIEEKDFYSGCYAWADVVPYAYDTAGNRGVAFYVQNIQKLADGESLTGRIKASEAFAPVEDAAGKSPVESIFG